MRITVQSKGCLYDETVALLEEAGIKLNRGKHILLLPAKGFPVEVLFLCDDDIPQFIANGVADTGIVGENEHVEKGQEAKLIKRLGFSERRLSLVIPKDEEYKGAEWSEGKTTATSCPAILRSFSEERGVKADIYVTSGSMEVAPGIGLADAVFDIVSSGNTLISNQLREVEVVLPREALLIANNNPSKEKLEILDELLFHFEAIQAAKGKKYVLLSVPKEKPDEIIKVLPGMKNPTITPSINDERVPVQFVIAEKHSWGIVGKPESLGAGGILVPPIEKMIVQYGDYKVSRT